MICNTIGQTADSYQSIYVTGGAEVAEIYGSIGYNDLIFLKSQTMTGDATLMYDSYPGVLTDYHIFGDTIQNDGCGEYDYVSGKYYIPVFGDTTELCDIHDIDRGTLRCGIAASGYYVDKAFLVNVDTQTSTPSAMLIPIKSATTYQVRFKTNTGVNFNDFVRVAFIDEFVNGASAYNIYTWQRGYNGDKLRSNTEYYVTMTNTNHRYIVIQSNLSPFGLFDYFSIQSVIVIGSYPLYRIGDYADEVDFCNQQIIRRINPTTMQPYATPITSTITVPQLTAAFGDNTLTVGTTVKPSAVSITGHIKPSSIYGNLTDVNGTYIKDKDGVQIKVTG